MKNIDMPLVNSIDPTVSGTIHKPSEMLSNLEKRIQAKILFDPDRFSYPESFAEFVRSHFKSNPDGNVLILPPNTVIDGDLVLDWREPWVIKSKVCAIVCEGDLTVKGEVLNRTLEGGVLLFVDGSVSCHNLIKGGAPVIVLENLLAANLIIGEYNDGIIRIGGDLNSRAYLLFDHDGFVVGACHARALTDEDGEWREVLVPELFDDEDDFHPNVDRLWSFSRAGEEIFL